MADKVFIGGLCPKFIISSDWSVNGNGIVNCWNGRGCVASIGLGNMGVMARRGNV